MRSDWKKNWRALITFFVLLTTVFVIFMSWGTIRVPMIDTREEQETFDFSAEMGHVSRNLFDCYPNALYTPEDFAAGVTGTPAYTIDSENNGERKKLSYETERLLVNLPEGQVYTINADSATYAQKVWVDGQLLSEVGQVSDSPEGFVPKTDNYTISFTAGSGPTEIVIQRSNFVHAEGTIFEIYLGPQEQVLQMANLRLVRSVFVISALITAAMFFASVFLFFRDRKQYLWFALSCLFIALRSAFVSPKPIMIVFPSLNWYFGHKLECCQLPLALFFLLLFYADVFRGRVPRKVRLAGYIVCLGSAGVYALLPSVVYSRFTQTIIYVICGYMLVYIGFLFAGLRRSGKEFRQQEYVLMYCGVVASFLMGMLDGMRYHRAADRNYGQIGMLLYVFLNTMALVLELRKTEDALDEAAAREEETRQANNMLTRLIQIRSSFLSDISHEMKTPLTVMSGYAGLTKKQIEKQAVNAETLENLEIIQQESVRLGHMVEQMKNYSASKDRAITLVDTNLNELLYKAADFCRPICAKNNNTVVVDTPDTPIIVRAMSESVLQVLYNLIINSNRHCQNSLITLRTRREGGKAVVWLIDRGDGIEPDILKHAFERGVSGDKSTGLGLALCRDIVSDHEGDISIESVIGEGTTVKFTLRLKESEQ